MCETITYMYDKRTFGNGFPGKAFWLIQGFQRGKVHN